MMDSSRNPKRQANKALVPGIVSSSSRLPPGTRLFASIGNSVYAYFSHEFSRYFTIPVLIILSHPNQQLDAPAQSLHAVSFTLPEFWQHAPELYFIRLKSAFYSAHVTKELAKYHTLVEVLPASVISQVQSLLSNPPADAPFSMLKAEILRLNTVSDRQPYHQLIKEELLGERKSSELLRRMRSLLGDMQVDDKFVKEMSLERLPADVQTILASGSQDLTVSQLAAMADRMIEVQRFQSPFVVQISTSTSTVNERLMKQVSAMTDEMASLKLNLARLTSSRSLSRRRSRSRNWETSQPENRRDRFLWLFRLWSHLLCLRQCDSQTFPGGQWRHNQRCSPTPADHRFPSPCLHLQVANCSPIPTFGSLSLTLNNGLRRSFTWIFVIADVPHAILGADFHAEFDLNVDCRRVRLLDRTTGLCWSPFRKAVFSNIDLVRAFHQIAVAPEDVTRPFGLFEFICMPFGLRNAAQTFQRFIGQVLRGLPFVYVYIDDPLVASRNEKEHKEHLALVFDCPDKLGVVINPFKCVLDVSSLESLGHHVNSEGLRPLPLKVEVICVFPPPTSERQLQRFLGMVSFYRRFLPNCNDLMLPLTNMLSGTKGPLELTGEALAAFERIKDYSTHMVPRQPRAINTALLVPPLPLFATVSDDGFE
ncbi:hypothetical protein SprV_0301264300 [Sparganum proliferum]